MLIFKQTSHYPLKGDGEIDRPPAKRRQTEGRGKFSAKRGGQVREGQVRDASWLPILQGNIQLVRLK